VPVFGIFVLLTDLLCIVHASKTGRPQYWFYIIIMLPGAGALAYFLFELLPEVVRGPEGRKAAAKVQKLVDPEKDLRAAIERLEITDSIRTRTDLAEECLAAGKPEMAVELYRAALKGIHASEPDLMFGLARALFANSDFRATQQTLEELRRENPKYQSAEGHLLYARSLEAQGNEEAALFEYAALGYYPGQEARCRHAELLWKRGERDAANRLFEEVKKAIERAPRVYAKSQGEWLLLAKRRLAEG